MSYGRSATIFPCPLELLVTVGCTTLKETPLNGSPLTRKARDGQLCRTSSLLSVI